MSVIIENIYTGDGQTVLYSFSFDYIDTEDIKVTVDSVETTDWTFATTQSIQFNSAPAQDAVIRIYRSTVVTEIKARFFAGSAIRAQDLNDNFEQFLYVTQETDLIAQRANTAADAALIAADAAEDAAETAESAAQTALTNSNAAAASAAQAASDAANAASDAQQAQTDAANAVSIANAADTKATNALAAASQAQSDATNAANSAAQAQSDATNAANSASAAQTSASNAATSANQAINDAAAAQATADAALPKAGGTMTGDITFNSTQLFDGRDVSADGTKLDGIESGATGDQTGAEIKTAYEGEADTNAFTDAEKTKLAGIETGATADQTGAEIKAAYEAENDTNAFTDAEQTKLAGIETGATADQTGAEIKAAYEGEADTNAFTDAEKTKLSGIEASADVTDATNVAAAGAVMESDTTTASMSFVVDEDDMVSNSDTKVPTQQSVKTYVDAEIAGLVDSAPTSLDTLNELASALGDDPNFATTVTNNIATKLPLAGGTMTGNIVMSGAQTVDGRDLSVDGAKLDGIEAGATADQNASEVSYDPATSGMTATDLQDAIDELDSRLDNSSSGGTSGPVFWSRSGTTVSPINSGDDVSVNGDISVTGTVDGRNLSVDGSKLDGIESGATADQTAAEIKTAYESNNDTNAFTDAEKTKLSGIETGATADQTGAEIKAAYEAENDTNAFTDAEKTKLSGIAAGAQVNVATNLGKTTTTTTNVITSSTGSNVTLNEASGSAAGLMSTAHHNKLDGIAAGAEVNVQSDWNASSGDAFIANKPTIPTNNNQLTNGAGYLDENTGSYSGQYPIPIIAAGHAYTAPTAGTVAITGSTGQITTPSHGNSSQWNTAYGWGNHASAGYITSADGGNAATLDGVDSSQFIRSDAADVASQQVEFTANATNNWDTIATSTGSQGCIEIYNTGSGNDAFMSFHVGGDYACYFGLDGGTNKLSVGGWSMGANSYAIYHEGNKPSLSDTGYTASTSATANTLAQRDSSGDLTSRYALTQYVNMSHGASTRSSDSVFYSSTDNYIRKNNATGFRSSLNVPTRTGGDASGTWGISITGSAGTLGGYGWTTYGKNIRGSEIYADGWFRNYTAGYGLHNEATGCHFVSDANEEWTVKDSGNTIRIKFKTNSTTDRGAVYANQNSEIGFLNSSQSWSLRCDNSGNVTATGNVTAYSDIRLKSDIKPITNALDKVSQINGVTFTRVDSGERQVGVIAQDVEKVLPEAVRDGEEYKSVAYGNMVGLLIEAVKEQQATIQQLTERIETLEGGK